MVGKYFSFHEWTNDYKKYYAAGLFSGEEGLSAFKKEIDHRDEEGPS